MVTMATEFIIPPKERILSPLCIPRRLLMGPGPSNLSNRVLRAMSNPLLGHLHPEFLEIMDDVKEGLKYLFQTTSRHVFCVSGTGHAGMEAVMTNLLEPEDVILILKNGIWGERAGDMARRQGADVRFLEKSPGQAASPKEIESSLIKHSPSVLFVVHVESSTGVLQDLQGIGNLCRKQGVILVVDTVASLGGCPFFMDKWKIDVAYTGSQKVLSCPPSLAPVAVTDKVMNKINKRTNPPRSYYFDFQHLANYWGCDDFPRRYHHTGPVTSIYALREGLGQVAEEGLRSLWRRHEECAQTLRVGIEELGLDLFVSDPLLRAPTITSVKVPPGVSWKAVSSHLMKRYSIELSGGLGPTTGAIWRVGLLGENCTKANVALFLKAFSEALSSQEILVHKL